MPSRGDNFRNNGYVPRLADVVHLNWSPAEGVEMRDPHYGLVLSDNLFNTGTGLAVIVPITSKIGKLSGFELPVQVGRVNGVAILSGLRALDYQTRNIQFENTIGSKLIQHANHVVRMIFP